MHKRIKVRCRGIQMATKKIVLVLALLFSTPAFAQKQDPEFSRSKNFAGFEEGQTAISLFLGQPTFARYDYWLHWRSALFFDFGYHWDRYLYGAINYAYYFYNTRDFLRKRDKNIWNSLLFYGGPGFFTGFSSGQSADTSVRLGVRIFGGVEYLFDGQKYSLRTEIAPAIYIQGQSAMGVQGMIGLTYYFGDPKHTDILKIENKKSPGKKSIKDVSDDDLEL